MAGFSIIFTGATVEGDPAVAVGEIHLGEYREHFHAIVRFWSTQDYEASWTAALRRLLAGGAVSCLVASLTDPQVTTFVTTWPLYRDDEEVFVQNRLLFLDELPAPSHWTPRGSQSTRAQRSTRRAAPSLNGKSHWWTLRTSSTHVPRRLCGICTAPRGGRGRSSKAAAGLASRCTEQLM